MRTTRGRGRYRLCDDSRGGRLIGTMTEMTILPSRRLTERALSCAAR